LSNPNSPDKSHVQNGTFDLEEFLPYILNRAAERASLEFQKVYKARYGMLRTEWRVLFHLGRYGEMTARAICDRGGLHKTKVSRAVKTMEQSRLLTRTTLTEDRRHEVLRLTTVGQAAYRDLSQHAVQFDTGLTAMFSPHEIAILRSCLRKISALA
jgi:DNA-binding MarR family transcriptional regulator